MTVDKTFLIRSIQKKQSMIVAFCAYTNMPFVICDPETFNDQVWIFDSEKLLQDFAKQYTEKKILLKGIKYQNKNFLSFFSMLFTIGVNELVFVGEGRKEMIELEDLIKRPDYSKLPKEQQPVFNPELQLTGLYFMQEASRPVPNEEKESLKDLEEELSSNLTKGRYVVPIELLEGPESDMEKLKNKKYRLPILKNKNGDMLQPLFTDPTELGKFNREGKFKALAVPFNNLPKLLTKESKGFLLNPAGFHIALPKELLDGLAKRFGVEMA
ncbi:MAG: SseB family protein [Candidatus Choladocola sp.]|nr:SseB family protein [Candidatus Choladocola sp.]